jgi:hypothetical protein
VTSSEEQAGPASDRAREQPVRADQNSARRPVAETQPADQRDVDLAVGDAQGDLASEHDSLTVSDDPLDKRSESDASN